MLIWDTGTSVSLSVLSAPICSSWSTSNALQISPVVGLKKPCGKEIHGVIVVFSSSKCVLPQLDWLLLCSGVSCSFSKCCFPGPEALLVRKDTKQCWPPSGRTVTTQTTVTEEKSPFPGSSADQSEDAAFLEVLPRWSSVLSPSEGCSPILKPESLCAAEVKAFLRWQTA